MLNRIQIFRWILILTILVIISLVASQANKPKYVGDYNDLEEGDDIGQNQILQLPPYKMDPEYTNPYKPVRKTKRKKPQRVANTTDSLCVRVLKRKKAAEELENPQKKYVASGNRWHGPVAYGDYKSYISKHQGRSSKLRDITPVERKLHKCYKWVNSKDLKTYTWPAIIQTIESQDLYHIEICCPQFGPLRVMGNTLCRPYCTHCRNGDCMAPEKCRCFDGFVLTDNEDCAFTCPISCLNGRCNLILGTCLCNSGYKLDETGKFCRPICSAGCGTNPLHNCTAPESCGCVKGYSLSDNDCQPIIPKNWWVN